ncbi:CP3AO-like protein [Mya arenaria]|uniref:CP3AO-like protein n=1 Tax=Mya arenaria TaxID=6604 RepID=A0ABY7DD33_MYAAR|nr:cytochrome P450 3A24-like [Mya arenaria]WAQ94506.1 CP3AO-like protein [Mya arenaria]
MYIGSYVYIPWWIDGPVGFIVTVVALLYMYTTYKHGYFRRRGIKCDTPVPFMGHLKQLFALGSHEYDRQCAKRYGGVWGCFYGNYPVVMVGDPDRVKEILITQFSKFYNRSDTVQVSKVWENSVNNAKGVKWKYLRAILQPTFSSGKIKSMRPILKRCLDTMIECLDERLEKSEDQVIDMGERFKTLTMDVICSTAFGIEVDSQRHPDDPFVKHASNILDGSITRTVLMLNFLFPDIQPLIKFLSKDFNDPDAMQFLDKTVRKAIQERRKNNSGEFNDLLKLMMDTQTDSPDNGVSSDKSFEQMKQSGMSENDITINGIIFLAAGHETTAALLGWLAYVLAQHPEVQDRLVEEVDALDGRHTTDNITYDSILKMDFLEMIMQETLRLYPPVGRFNRQPTRDITINGFHFEKGMDITFSTNAIHRNPKYWPEPERFDPERFSPENKQKIYPYSYIPFGGGPRNCIGMKLALVEAKMALVRLLQNFRLERSDRLKVPPVVENAGGLLRPRDLYIKLVRR